MYTNKRNKKNRLHDNSSVNEVRNSVVPHMTDNRKCTVIQKKELDTLSSENVPKSLLSSTVSTTETIQRVPIEGDGVVHDHEELLDQDDKFDAATTHVKGIGKLLNSIHTEKEKRNGMDATDKEIQEYVELERLRKKLDIKMKLKIGAGGSVKLVPEANTAKLNAYKRIFDKALMNPMLRSLKVSPILHKLHALYQSYEALKSTTANLVRKLKIAEEIAAIALQLPEGVTFQKVRYALHKFPHVILDEGQSISLSDLSKTVTSLGDEAREIGLVDVSNVHVPGGGLGVFYGPKESALVRAGATVSAPGSKISGFEGTHSRFIAHTHPRHTHVQKAHTGELGKDIESSTRRFELVRTASQKTLYYNSDGSINAKERDRFANHIKKPTFANNKLVWFHKLKEGQRFKNRPPGVSEVEKYRAMGEHEIHMIWDKILRIKDTINTERLTRNQYNLYLDKFTALMNILETGTLRAFDLFWKAFPTEPDPDYRAPKPFTLFDFLDSSDDGESSEEDGDPKSKQDGQ